jgi:TolB-like protein
MNNPVSAPLDSQKLDAAGRLESWKEIAAYLRRQVRTVNLWEKSEGLPVHRHLHSKRGTVYAYKTELDEWLRQRATSKSAQPIGARRSRVMVAVLPFGNLSGDAAQDYFSNGLTEEMISQLGRIAPNQFGVIARTSSMHYKHSDKSVAEIGAELGVEYILEGSVRRWGDRVRITAQLISVKGQLNIWSESYDREVADIFLLQTDVARQICESMVAELNSASVPKQPRTATITSQDAYDSYLRGRNYWNQRTDESLLKAVHYFSQAIRLDPNLAVAHCGLGDAYNLLAVYGVLPPHEAMPLARKSALRALEVNRELGEAHACLADVSCFYDWDWKEANREYQQALSLNPSYATGHHFYASFLSAMGQQTHALAEIELALAYDPHSVIMLVWKSLILRLAGIYADAIETAAEAVKLDPEYVLAHWALALGFEAAGEMHSALAEFETAANLSGSSPGMLASLGYNVAIQGMKDRASEILARLQAISAKRYVSAYHLANMYVGMGENVQALNYLDKAFQERSTWVISLGIEPRMQCLKHDAFFQSLLRKLHLPEPDAISTRDSASTVAEL